MSANKPAVAQLLQQAMNAHRLGQFAVAANLYASVLAKEPRNADALHLCGALRLQQGQADEAARLIGAALSQRPRDPDILGNHAAALAAGGQCDKALAAYDKLLAMFPRHPGALHGRGAMLTRLGRSEEALRALDSALAVNASDPRLWFDRGNALAAAHRMEEAVAAYDRAHGLAPRQGEILINRGNALASLQAYERALASYDQALQIDPNSVGALSNKGNALKALRRFDEALAAYARALALQPDHADTLNNCGALLFELDRPADALRYFEQALKLRPNDIDFINHRGTALLHLDRNEEALANAEHSLRIDPNNFEAHSYYLKHGRLAEGWRLYEYRWSSGKGGQPRPYPQPFWKGEKSAGPLLVWAEQGLGDHILFASMIPDLRERVDKIVLEVEPRLVSLFARSFPGIEVVAMQPTLYGGAAAAQICLTSLGQFFRPDWAAFPGRPGGFLVPDPDRAAAIRQRLGRDGRPVVGLSWHSRKAQWSQSKSAQLSDFTGLLRAIDARWIDLQYGDNAAERAAFARETGLNVEHVDEIDNTSDIEGLAALIAACDAVVSVSNTTAHLAGALGRPAWVLAPFGHSRMWYWHAHRPNSPWYPNVRVRPQQAGQAWPQLTEAIAAEVSAFCRARKDAAP